MSGTNGFEYGWTYDSHILWQEAYPLLTLLAVHTKKLKFGHCVTNPGTREPTVTASAYATLHDISGGRMVMGIGRGDSSRRVIGYTPKHCSWLNQIEIWFSILVRRALKRASFSSTEDLATRIREFIAYFNRVLAKAELRKSG